MHGRWREMQAGWRDARWSFYFTIALLPSVIGAVFLSYLIEGKATTPPSPLTWLLCAAAAMFSLYWAGLKDGLDGRFGRHVWLLTLLLVGYWLMLSLLRSHQSEGKTRVRLAGQAFNIFVSSPRTTTGAPASAGFAWGDIRWERLATG
jgi:hypothetical protein